jgi:hypothetical protein
LAFGAKAKPQKDIADSATVLPLFGQHNVWSPKGKTGTPKWALSAELFSTQNAHLAS